jgi:hypothetical protein
MYRTEEIVDRPTVELPDVPYCTDAGIRISLALRPVSSVQRSAMFRHGRQNPKPSATSNATSDQEMTWILAELRLALRQHVERHRARVASYPVMVERRTYPSSGEASNSK